MKNSILAEPELVGREKELEKLQNHLNQVREGKGTTIFVSGEAGSGKTRLTIEFLKRAKQNGVIVLSGWCLSDAAVPYFPFVGAFNTYFSTNFKEESLTNQKIGAPHTATTSTGIEQFGIAAWLSGTKSSNKLEKSGMISPEIWKDQVFDAAGKTLQSISTQGPLIFFIEDVHWADSASLALLHYISRIIGSEKILILATFRSEELTADEEGRAHPLAEIMRLMKREDLYSEIKLANLDQATISKVAEIMLDGSIQPALAEKLANESRGNALYIVESLRMLSEQNQLVKENNKWRLSAEEVGIPSKFKDIVLRRIGALKFNQRRVLDAASVIGEKFDVDLLGAVLAQDNLEVLETLYVISQSTSLVNVEEDFFRFDHAKVRETIYKEIPLPLKKGYHTRVAQKLEGKSQPLPLSDIAYHYAQSGNTEKTVEYALAAGIDELARFANAETIEHLTYVLQNLPEHPGNAEKMRIVLEGLGDAYFLNGKFTKAAEMFERLAHSSNKQVKLRAYRKAMDAIFFGGRSIGTHDRLIELATEAEPHAASDRLENARIRFHKGGVLDTYVARAKEFAAVLQVFEEEYSLPDLARALEATGSAESLCFEEKGMSKTLLAMAMFEERGDLRGFTRAAITEDGILLVFGLIQEAFDLATKIIKFGEKIGDYKTIATAYLRWGRSLELKGQLDEALSKATKAAEYFEKIEKTGLIEFRSLRNSAFLARLRAKAGNLEVTEECYEQLARYFSESHTSSNPNTIVGLPDYRLRPCPAAFSPRNTFCEVARALGVLAAAQGRWEEADQYFKEASVIADETGWITVSLGVKRDYAWALEKQGKTEEAKAQLAEWQKYLDEVDERFAHVRLDAFLFAPRRIVVGEEFETRLSLVNVSRKPALLVSVRDLVPLDLTVTSSPAINSLDKGSIEMNERSLGPFQVQTFVLRLKASKPATFTLNPVVAYINELGETKTCEPRPVLITVQPARPAYEVLPNRIPTGLSELDALLLGGIPKNYAVVLASSACDEKELIVKRFLEAGVANDEISFHLTAEAANTKMLATEYPSNFFMFICNLQANAMVQSSLNVFKLKGVENLTEIDIALAKVIRMLKAQTAVPKRICIEVLSDVLLQHHAVTTRKWLSGLLAVLKSEGFTTLAVLNSGMHSREELQAVLGLFEGEIGIYDKETGKGIGKVLRVRRLYDRRFLDDELLLVGEKMEQR